MWVKVCGVTTREAAEVAVEAGADAIGLVFVDSPRRLDPDAARHISDGLDVERVALVGHDSARAALDLLGEVGATGIQPYGRNAPEIADAAAAAGYLVLRPVRVGRTVDVSDVPAEQVPLLDTAHRELSGGTGRRFDWSLATGIERPYVAAGGIGPDNVSDLIDQLDPWGVDASSGLESAPGRKDLDLVRAFVLKAKQGSVDR